MESLAFTLLYLSLGYLAGSVPFSQIIAKWRSKADLRYDGYGNVGAYNVVRTTGLGWGILAGILDLCKGVSVLLLVDALGATYPTDQLAGLFAIVGHNYPVWLNFKGGKGVMVLMGLLVWLVPMETIVGTSTALLVFRAVRLVNVSVISGLIVIMILAESLGHFDRIEIVIAGAVLLIGLAYLPRFVRWLSLQFSR